MVAKQLDAVEQLEDIVAKRLRDFSEAKRKSEQNFREIKVGP